MRSCLISLIGALTLIAGCSDSGRLPTYPAGGTVQFKDGRPLAGGAILCESASGLAARAVINEDGTFRLGTYEEADGAVAGKHRVAIRPPSTIYSDAEGPVKRAAPVRIDDKYLSFEKSGIELEVKPGGDNQFTIEVAEPKR